MTARSCKQNTTQGVTMRLLKDYTEETIINVDAISTIYIKAESVLAQYNPQQRPTYSLSCELIGDNQPICLFSADYDVIKYYKHKLELALVSSGDNEIIEISEL